MRRSSRSLIAAILCGLSGCSSAPATPAGGVAAVSSDRGKAGGVAIERMEADVVRRVNAVRRERGLPALRTDRVLADAARTHSCRMATERFLGHEASDGSTPGDRVRAAGKAYRAIGENVAMNVNAADPVGTAVHGWLNSPGHRDNILHAAYTETGVGICRREARYYFTQVFLRPPS